MVLEDEWASLCNIIVRRNLFAALGGYEPSFRGMYEDQAFHAKLCLAQPIFVSSVVGYRYRQHPASCTSRSHGSGATGAARKRYLNWLGLYLSRAGGDLKAVRETLSLLQSRDDSPPETARSARKPERNLVSRIRGMCAGRRAGVS
jgi:hypothetical protein